MAFAQLGSAYHAAKETGKAVLAYEQAVVLAPDYSAAMHNLALCYFDDRNYEMAEQWFRKALTNGSTKDFHQVCNCANVESLCDCGVSRHTSISATR